MQFSARTLSGATALVLLCASCSTASGVFGSSQTTASTLAPTTTTTTTTTTTEQPTTTVANFSDTFAAVSDGVFRVDAQLCDDISSQGTGFLVGPNLLLTAAHVTGTAANAVVKRSDGYESEAEIIATDSDRDLALMKLATPVDGHHFEIGDEGIRVGDEVGAIGHPSGLPLTFTSGRMSSLNYEAGGVLFHQTDTPINPGNSGGPLINQRGTVVGLVDWKFYEVEGISFVVTADEISSFVNGTSASTIDLTLGCENQNLPLQAWETDDDLAKIPDMFGSYASLINSGDQGDAYDLYAGPRLREVLTRDKFIDGNSTSYLRGLEVYYAFWEEGNTAIAWVTFVSEQEAEFGPDGQTCSVWDLTYELVLDDGWKIQKAANESGSPSSCG